MHGIRILNNTSHKQLEDAYSPIGASWNRAREGPKGARREGRYKTMPSSSSGVSIT